MSNLTIEQLFFHAETQNTSRLPPPGPKGTEITSSKNGVKTLKQRFKFRQVPQPGGPWVLDHKTHLLPEQSIDDFERGTKDSVTILQSKRIPLIKTRSVRKTPWFQHTANLALSVPCHCEAGAGNAKRGTVKMATMNSTQESPQHKRPGNIMIRPVHSVNFNHLHIKLFLKYLATWPAPLKRSKQQRRLSWEQPPGRGFR